MLASIPKCQILEIPEAVHCDFEAKPSNLCYRLTGSKPDPVRTAKTHCALLAYSRFFFTKKN